MGWGEEEQQHWGGHVDDASTDDVVGGVNDDKIADGTLPGDDICVGDANHRGPNEIISDNDNDENGLIGNDSGDDIDGEDDELLGKVVGHNEISPSVEDDAGSACDSESPSTIYLSNGMVLYLKEVDTMLALVCLTRAENFRKKSLINYNIGCLKKALMALPQSA